MEMRTSETAMERTTEMKMVDLAMDLTMVTETPGKEMEITTVITMELKQIMQISKSMKTSSTPLIS